MPILFWDASALAKRYVAESGTSTVNALFTDASESYMIGTVLGYAETYSILLRHHNRGAISAATFSGAKSRLRVEVIENPSFELLTIGDDAIFSGIALMERHNINANDGAILTVFLRYIRALPSPAPGCVLVAADQRLVAAARAEGLKTLNPELVADADVPSLIAAL